MGALGAARRAQIEPFHVMEIVAAAAAQEAATGDVLHLEVGQPATGAPPSAVAAAIDLLGSGATLGYTPAPGIDPLRRRIAALYGERHGIQLDPSRVIVTAGASGAVVLALLTCFDAGARIVVTEPGYPCYRQMIGALDLEAVPVRIGVDDGFLLGTAALDRCLAAGPIDGVLVASPANPTGTVYDADRLGEITRWCRDHGVRLIADEIYHGITFGDPAPTALGPSHENAGPDDTDTVVIGSFSKYFSMTGWRLGWMVVPNELVQPVDRLSQNLYLCPPTLSQHVALAAFDDTAVLDAHVARYRANRDLMLRSLHAIGVTEIAPCDGAFYLYGNVSHWRIDSRELVDIWLRDLGVATAPGVDFDPVDGHHWIRWSLTGSTDDIAEAGRRLVVWAGRA